MLPLWFVIFPLPAFRASSVFLVELLQSFTSLEFMKPIKNRNLDGKNYYFIPPGLFSRMFLYAGRVHPLVCSNACRLSQQPRRTLLHLHQTAALFPSDLRTYIHNREIIIAGGLHRGSSPPPPPPPQLEHWGSITPLTLGCNAQGCLRVLYCLYSVTVCTGKSQ